MKKIFTLISVAMLGLCCHAQSLMTLSEDSPMLKPWNEISSTTKNVTLGSNAKSMAKAGNNDDSVFAVPEGTKRVCQLEEMTSESPYYGTLYVGYSDTIYVSNDEKTVYLPDMILMPGLDTHYVKGTITEGDIHNGTITIANNQPYAYNIQNLLYVTAIEMQGFDIYLQEKDAFEFKIVNDTIKSDGQMLGAVDANNMLYLFSRSYTMSPISEEQLQQNTIPENMTTSNYEMYQPDAYDPENGMRQIVKIARDGDDFYFYDLHGFIHPEDLVPVKGTLVDNTVVIKSPQYLGITDNMYVFFNAGETYTYIDEMWGEEVSGYRTSGADEIVLNYDPATGVMKADSPNGFAFTSGTYRVVNFVSEPKFTPFNYEPAVVPEGAEKKCVVMVTEPAPGDAHGQSALLENAYAGEEVYMQMLVWDDVVTFKGTVSGDKLLVSYPQYLGKCGNADCFLRPGTVVSHDDWGFVFNEFYATEGEGVLEFNYDAANGTISYGDIIVAADFNNYVQANLFNPTYTLFTDKVAEVPADAVVNQYTMKQTATFDDELHQVFKGYIANKGNDYYFMYLDPEDSTAVFKGTLENGKIRVAPQYIGGGRKVEYVYPGKFVEEESMWGDIVRNMYVDESLDAIYFDYDAATGKISYDGLIVFCYASGEINIYGHNNLSFTPLETKPATPADPIIDEVYYNDWIGCYELIFHANCIDTEGNYLDVENLTYRVYNDGSLYTFYADQYVDINEDTEEIPFLLSEREFYYSWEDGGHSARLFDAGRNTLGIEVVYTLDGTKYCSNIVNYDMTEVGINTVGNTAKPVSVEYFDLSGRKLTTPSAGITIKKVTYSDNTVETKKVLIK